MIVVDTSAWIELLRDTGSPVHRRLVTLLDCGSELAVTEVVVAEVLAGARSRSHRDALRDRLLAFPVLTLGGLAGYEHAADLYRTARQRGVTVHVLADCLVAWPALREAATVLHADRDFDLLAGVSGLQIEPVA